MKVAVVGKGKTGIEVINLINKDSALELIGPFGKEKPADFESLNSSDVIIAFVPGPAVSELIPLFMETKKPVIWAATGFDWPVDIDEQLKKQNIKWVHGTNFSLGMSIIRQLIKVFSIADQILPNPEFSIHEIHHTQKLDGPSGTAKSWKTWLNRDCKMSFDRIGDVPGIHELRLKTGNEEMMIRHESLNRKLFAQGSLWAANEILQNKTIPTGLNLFEHLTDEVINHAINQLQ